jgi:hypothetical protein
MSLATAASGQAGQSSNWGLDSGIQSKPAEGQSLARLLFKRDVSRRGKNPLRSSVASAAFVNCDRGVRGPMLAGPASDVRACFFLWGRGYALL